MKYLKTTSTALALLILSACNTTYEPSALYNEYPFDSGDDVDLGFTKRELEKLESEDDLLSEGSTVIEDQSMKYLRPTEKETSEGTTDKYQWNDDIYETKNEKGGNNASDNYVLLKNGEVIFEGPMVFSPIGAVIDWRIVEGKPAFTFNVAEKLEGNSVTYTQDIWYEGELMSEKFSVENPRYLFSYEGKLGFVAMSNGMDSIFYDGKVITPGFTQIWTANCCSYTEILPTVYENGTLLFYAKRDGLNYLVETSLKRTPTTPPTASAEH